MHGQEQFGHAAKLILKLVLILKAMFIKGLIRLTPVQCIRPSNIVSCDTIYTSPEYPVLSNDNPHTQQKVANSMCKNSWP